MSDLDLTAAVEAAARIMHDANCYDADDSADWTDHANWVQETWRAEAREVLSAVAPVIAAQARREALTELAERLRSDAWKLGHLAAEAEANDMDYTATQLAAKADGIRLALGVIEEALR